MHRQRRWNWPLPSPLSAIIFPKNVIFSLSRGSRIYYTCVFTRLLCALLLRYVVPRELSFSLVVLILNIVRASGYIDGWRVEFFSSLLARKYYRYDDKELIYIYKNRQRSKSSLSLSKKRIICGNNARKAQRSIYTHAHIYIYICVYRFIGLSIAICARRISRLKTRIIREASAQRVGVR